MSGVPWTAVAVMAWRNKLQAFHKSLRQALVGGWQGGPPVRGCICWVTCRARMQSQSTLSLCSLVLAWVDGQSNARRAARLS